VDWASGRLLRHRAFRTVPGGEVVSVLGDYPYRVAFAWLVLSVSGSVVTILVAPTAAPVASADQSLTGVPRRSPSSVARMAREPGWAKPTRTAGRRAFFLTFSITQRDPLSP